MKITRAIIDAFLYCQIEDDQVIEINESYVDDLFRAGTEKWKTHLDATLERSETTGNQQTPSTLARMHISDSDNMYHIYQDFFMSKIYQIISDAEFNKFASLRMRLALLANTRPDTVFEISHIDQVTR